MTNHRRRSPNGCRATTPFIPFAFGTTETIRTVSAEGDETLTALTEIPH